MKYLPLLLLFLFLLPACDNGRLAEDAKKFAEMKCQLKEIDGRKAAGELNWMETEDEKEPLFEEMDQLRRYWKESKVEFDSLVGIELGGLDCGE